EVTDMKIIGSNPLGRTYSLYSSKNNKIHYFYRSRGDKVSNEVVTIVHDKHSVKKHFEKSAVPTPKGIMFDKKSDNKAIKELISGLSYPLVVKPTLDKLGKGVVINIQTAEELIGAIDYIRDHHEFDDIIVEQYVAGEKYRIYVVEDKVVAATKK